MLLLWALVGWFGISVLVTPFIGALLGGTKDVEEGVPEAPVAIPRSQHFAHRRRRNAARRVPTESRLRAHIG